MSARDNAVQSLINGGYGKRQAEEILSLVCGEAREQGFQAGRRAVRTEMLREAADRVDVTEFPDDYIDQFDNGARWATAELRHLAASSPRTAGDEQPESAVEFGVRTPSGVLTPTHDRAEAEQRLARSQYPTAVLVQRTVRYGPWIEVAS